MRLLITVLLAGCLAAACGNSTKQRVSTGDANSGSDPRAEPAGPVVLDDVGGLPGSPTVDALETLAAIEQVGGLTQLPTATATQIIDAYIGALAQRTDAGDMVDDLELIRGELTSGIIDRGEVGRALLRLGERTREVADEKSPYQSLGSALIASGEQLTGQ